MQNDSGEKFMSYIERRLAREPLQHIVGSTEFMSLPFETRPGVFVREGVDVFVAECDLEEVGSIAKGLDRHANLAVVEPGRPVGFVGCGLELTAFIDDDRNQSHRSEAEIPANPFARVLEQIENRQGPNSFANTTDKILAAYWP